MLSRSPSILKEFEWHPPGPRTVTLCDTRIKSTKTIQERHRTFLEATRGTSSDSRARTTRGWWARSSMGASTWEMMRWSARTKASQSRIRLLLWILTTTWSYLTKPTQSGQAPSRTSIAHRSSLKWCLGSGLRSSSTISRSLSNVSTQILITTTKKAGMCTTLSTLVLDSLRLGTRAHLVQLFSRTETGNFRTWSYSPP